MEFYRERIVKNPQKTYKCMLCGKDIKSKHFYVTGKDWGDFFSFREHLTCNENRNKMCSDCEYNDDCCVNLQDCFYEKILKVK